MFPHNATSSWVVIVHSRNVQEDLSRLRVTHVRHFSDEARGTGVPPTKRRVQSCEAVLDIDIVF